MMNNSKAAASQTIPVSLPAAWFAKGPSADNVSLALAIYPPEYSAFPYSANKFRHPAKDNQDIANRNRNRGERRQMLYRKNTKAQKEVAQTVEELDYRFLEDLKADPVYPSLDDNKEFLKELFKDCSDVVIREIRLERGPRALIVFVDGLVDTAAVNEMLRSIMIFEGDSCQIEQLSMQAIPVNQLKKVDNYGDFLQSVLSGDTGILVDNQENALVAGIRGPQTRSVNEPETESVIRGPREGFIENLRTNTSMIRRKLKTPRLKMKPLVAGKESQTNLVVCYMEDIADPALVEEVVNRIRKIDIDAVLESGYIEEFIQDSYLSPFPQMQYTERPDTVAGAILQGRVAILIDGTPMALIVPFVFLEILQANEDYFERFYIATLVRWLRYIFMILSLITPALYVAITTYHQDLLPTNLLLSVAASREAIPFPAVIEALIMEITFEALREAGIRLPKAIGSAVSILGALVIGQAAVEAGIVSAPMVIVVSITGIASFTIPRYNGAISIRMLRFPLLIAASIFGMLGILGCLLLIVGHLANLRSFGVPYLSPLAPLSTKDLRDSLARAPWPALFSRPSFLTVRDTERVGKQIHDEIFRQEGQKGIDIPHSEPRKGQ
jgi:spore germination protein KA/spore germination protein